MTKLIALTLLLVGCTASPREGSAGGGADAASASDARIAPAVVFRVPGDGGPVSAYALPGLEPLPRTLGVRTARPRSALGVDFLGRRLLYRDSAGAVTSFDLVAARERSIAPRRSLVALASDGTLFTVDSGGVITESQVWGPRPWNGSLGRGVRQVFAAGDGRLIAIRHAGGDSLLVTSREAGVTRALAVPEAVDRAASKDGDAVAFATDSGLVVTEDREPGRMWSVRLAGHPRAVAFSPSGHRLYVALRDKSELAVVDRFTHAARPGIALPGPAAALRADPWGRVLLVRGDTGRERGDMWVIGTAREAVIGRLDTHWRTDLPAVSESGVLLCREGDAIVARDLYRLDSLGAVGSAEADLWFPGRWAAPPPTAAARLAASDTGRGTGPAATPRPATTAPAAAPPSPPAATLWVQVSVSQNETWARALASELTAAGHTASVVAPRGEGGGWRVMMGPYPTRDAADSVGRALGRPYWVVDRSREAARP